VTSHWPRHAIQCHRRTPNHMSSAYDTQEFVGSSPARPTARPTKFDLGVWLNLEYRRSAIRAPGSHCLDRRDVHRLDRRDVHRTAECISGVRGRPAATTGIGARGYRLLSNWAIPAANSALARMRRTMVAMCSVSGPDAGAISVSSLMIPARRKAMPSSRSSRLSNSLMAESLPHFRSRTRKHCPTDQLSAGSPLAAD